MSNSEQLAQKIDVHLRELQSLSGEVLMSGLDTLTKKTSVIIFGFNPGGENLPSIKQQYQWYQSRDKHQKSYSAYIDQCWHSPEWEKGENCSLCQNSIKQYIHQKRAEAMITSLGLRPAEALTLNGIFIQSKSIQALKALIKTETNHKKLYELFQNVFGQFINGLLSQ